MNIKAVNTVAKTISHSTLAPVAKDLVKHNLAKSTNSIMTDVFVKSAKTAAKSSAEVLKTAEKQASKGVGTEAKNVLTELYNKYFKKINVGKKFIEGSNIEKCEDAGLLSKDLVSKIKKSGDIFTTKDLFQMEEMHELGIYSIDDIIRFRGSEAKLTNLGKSVNFKKEAELTKNLEEYVGNISGFVKKDAHALEVSTKSIDKYISVKGEPIAQKTLYRGIIDDEEITRILSKAKSPDAVNHFYTPNRITSTSKDITEAARASQNKLVLKIDIPNAGTSNAAKSVDINKYYDAKGIKNDFAFQKEVLLPSNCKFQLFNVEEKNGTIFVNARLAQ